jgi:hypothetical protein
MMKPVVLALASDERYFPGLYCAVASACFILASTGRIKQNQEYAKPHYAKSLPLLALQECAGTFFA